MCTAPLPWDHVHRPAPRGPCAPPCPLVLPHYLLLHHHNISIQGGKTPLDVATERGHLQVAVKLLAAQATTAGAEVATAAAIAVSAAQVVQVHLLAALLRMLGSGCGAGRGSPSALRKVDISFGHIRV